MWGRVIRAGVAAGLICVATTPAPSQAGVIDYQAFGSPNSGPINQIVSYSDSLWVVGLRDRIQLNQPNNVVASLDEGDTRLTLIDAGQPMLPLPDSPLGIVELLNRCQVFQRPIVCTSPPGLPFNGLNIQLGGANDKAEVSGNAFNVWGGQGNDSLTGGAGDQGFDGGAGDDEISAGPGDDAIGYPTVHDADESSGADLIDPGRGEDRVGATGDGDRVLARDGERDLIRCFGSAATVIADPVDDLADCPNAQIG